MTISEFRRDPAARHRYWARSYLGWQQIANARPNDGHRAVAALQRAGLIGPIITQNVDGLHQAAGAHEVVELHGALSRVVCLNCGAFEPRVDLGGRLRAANPGFGAEAVRLNPDGDVELPDERLAAFEMVDCRACGRGPLKPDVVFFGENVPRPRVERAFAAVDAAHSLLVLGSSLSVLSGLRFVRRAAAREIAIAIVNQGRTRGDELASVRVDAALGATLRALVSELRLRAIS